MNLDEVFSLDAQMPLVATNPVLMLGCIVTSVLLGWICVYKYRNTYEIERSIRLFVPLALADTILFTLAGIPILFCIGAQLCGFVGMLLISNYYFRH